MPSGQAWISVFSIRLLKRMYTPPWGPLLKIAKALGVRLGTFLDDQISKDPLVIRSDARKEELSMLRGKG